MQKRKIVKADGLLMLWTCPNVWLTGSAASWLGYRGRGFAITFLILYRHPLNKNKPLRYEKKQIIKASGLV